MDKIKSPEDGEILWASASTCNVFDINKKSERTSYREVVRIFNICERAVKRCVNTGKNEEKVCRYTVRQIGIGLVDICSRKDTDKDKNNTCNSRPKQCSL